MKQTIQGIALGVIGSLLIALGSAAIVVEGRNHALRRTITNMNNANFNLTMEIVALRTVDNDCRTLQYVLPQVCMSELSRTAWEIKRLEERAR